MAGPLPWQGLPQIGTPIINPDGTMNFTWYRFFESLWKRSGLATPGMAVNGYYAGATPSLVELAAQFAYIPRNSGAGTPPTLVVFDQNTALVPYATAPKQRPVGYVQLNEF